MDISTVLEENTTKDGPTEISRLCSDHVINDDLHTFKIEL